MAVNIHAQQASVLPVCLILLLMISLLAMDSMASATLQMKLAAARLEHDRFLRLAEQHLAESEAALAAKPLVGLQQHTQLSAGQSPRHQALLQPIASLHAGHEHAGMLMGIDSWLHGEGRDMHLQSTWLAITGETPENDTHWSICLWPDQSACLPLQQHPVPGRQSWREIDGEQ